MQVEVDHVHFYTLKLVSAIIYSSGWLMTEYEHSYRLKQGQI